MIIFCLISASFMCNEAQNNTVWRVLASFRCLFWFLWTERFRFILTVPLDALFHPLCAHFSIQAADWMLAASFWTQRSIKLQKKPDISLWSLNLLLCNVHTCPQAAVTNKFSMITIWQCLVYIMNRCLQVAKKEMTAVLTNQKMIKLKLFFT